MLENRKDSVDRVDNLVCNGVYGRCAHRQNMFRSYSEVSDIYHIVHVVQRYIYCIINVVQRYIQLIGMCVHLNFISLTFVGKAIITAECYL